MALVAVSVLGAGLWRAGESDARVRNGLIAYTKETGNCDDFECNSVVWTVRPDGKSKRRLPCSTGGGDCRDILPVFSSEGGRLATATVGLSDFTGGRERIKNILAVRDPRGRVLRRIPFDEVVTGLAWSPDATQLAVNSFGLLYIVGSDGTNKKLFRKVRALDVEWSRQGRLTWSSKHGFAIRVTDRARTRVRTLRAKARSVAWSPDGRRLAYTAPPQLIKTIGVDGRGRRTVTRRCTSITVNLDSGIAWSPDGKQMLCTNDDNQLIAINVRTGRARVVGRGTPGLRITSFDWQRAPRR